jgi:ferritin heavy chain
LITGDLDGKEHFNNLEFIDMKSNCVKLTEEQIEKEITASLKYLSLGAYFSQDNVNRPGFSKFFFDAASEEREHAEKLIEYLSMRGRFFEDAESPITTIEIGKLVKKAEKAEKLGFTNLATPTPQANGVSAGLESLKTALRMEKAVTDSIKSLIIACEAEKTGSETFNDYHVSLIQSKIILKIFN